MQIEFLFNSTFGDVVTLRSENYRVFLFSLRLSCIQPGIDWQQYATRGGEIFVHLTGMVCLWAGNLTADFWKMSMSMSRFYWFSLFCTGNSFVQVYKSSAHNVTLEIGVIFSLLHDSRIQPSWISRNMLLGQNSVPATELFRKSGDVTRGKLSLQHVPATCRRDTSPREGTFFLGGGGGLGPQRGGSSVKMSTKRGGPYLMWAIQGRVTHLFQNFLMRIFVMLLSIFLTD